MGRRMNKKQELINMEELRRRNLNEGDVFVLTFGVLECKKFYECKWWIYGHPDERNLM